MDARIPGAIEWPRCPKCGSSNTDRDEVDIGVGTQCGPLGCFDCGWIEGREPPELICPQCNGTGSDGQAEHQDENGQSELEPLRCVSCDGIGRL
jgi:hypothetical protein